MKAHLLIAGDMDAVSVGKKDIYFLGLNLGSVEGTKEQQGPATNPASGIFPQPPGCHTVPF